MESLTFGYAPWFVAFGYIMPFGTWRDMQTEEMIFRHADDTGIHILLSRIRRNAWESGRNATQIRRRYILALWLAAVRDGCRPA